MAFEDFKTKESVVLVYTGEGKGKTSAAIGLMARALGNDWRVAFIQFIKHWEVSEHKFITKIQKLFGDKLFFYKGGKGFYHARELSAEKVTSSQHKQAAKDTYEQALKAVKSGKFELVICDEINNAVYHNLLTKDQLKKLIESRSPKTSLCLTGRYFPDDLLPLVDIATRMTKIKHHFDEKYLANQGIDF
ncbi:cob(I)yrinic acid a,c-diamide adenosyltransferase [Candidatus Saccharibacteria bacterium]|nr:cob(I)yrinic acid a,c-diamide adenosyltransferase [Candidatus Saccharibacteria bacterium]